MSDPSPANRTSNVLFPCYGNAAPSILAESLLTKDEAVGFHAFSAGCRPKGVAHPRALKILQRPGFSIGGFNSMSRSGFALADAPVMDFVFTVGRNAAGGTFLARPGEPMTAQRFIRDPEDVEGKDLQKEAPFAATFQHLKNRIRAFSALPVASLDKASRRAQRVETGQSDGASTTLNSAD